MFDFPLFPKISMLEWSMKICSDSLPDFSNVGAVVMAGKLVLKSMMPLLVRSNRSVRDYKVYLLGFCCVDVEVDFTYTAVFGG